jgi:hypothetical protein
MRTGFFIGSLLGFLRRIIYAPGSFHIFPDYEQLEKQGLNGCISTFRRT